MIRIRIMVHVALNFTWQEEPQYQGYIPQETTWNDVANAFEKKGHSIGNPMELTLVKGDSTMIVDVCAIKRTGQMLPLSSKTTPLESQFALCVLKQEYVRKVAITF